jgi:hypothetical protein
MVNRPVTIRIPCAGFDPGATVAVKVLELQNLGGDPIDTLQAKVDQDGASATVTWTYDHSQHQDKVSRACFVFMVEASGRSAMSRPLEFLDHFEATVTDANGNVAANRDVVLHADRGTDVRATTDAQGKVSVDVPPGQYHVQLLAPAPRAPVTTAPRGAGPAQAAPGDDESTVAAAGDQNGAAAGGGGGSAAPADAQPGAGPGAAGSAPHVEIPTLKVPACIAPDVDAAEIKYEIVDPSAAITTATLALLDGNGAVLSSRELTADERANGPHTLSWKGEVFGPSPPELPGGFVTLDHSPYAIQVTATSANGTAPSPKVPVEVRCTGISLELGPKSLLSEARDQALYDTLGELPAPGSMKKLVLVSDLFRADSGEVSSDASFTKYRDDPTQGWGDGPRVPIVARALFRSSTGTDVLAPKAWGDRRVLWDWSGVAEDTSKLAPAAKTYIDGARAYSPDSRGNLCHVDFGGKRSPDGKPAVFLQAGSVPLVPANTRFGAALTGPAVGGDLDGLSGVLFQPSRIAGDLWKVTVFFGAATADLDQAGNINAPLTRATGCFEVWRRGHVVRYVKKNASVESIDFGPAKGHLAKAYIDLVVTSPSTMSDIQGFDYNAKVAENFADAFNGYGRDLAAVIKDPNLWVDPKISQLATGTSVMQFRSYGDLTDAAVAKRKAELVATGASEETAKSSAKSDVDAALAALMNLQQLSGHSSPDSEHAHGTLCALMASQVAQVLGLDVAGGVGITVMHFEGAANLGPQFEGGNTPFLVLDDASHRVVVNNFLWRGQDAAGRSALKNSRETTTAHEIGHAFFLPHAAGTSDPDPTAHDKNDFDGCLMSYTTQDHFCGVCNLRLRGWNFTKLPGRGDKTEGSS